VFNYYPVYFVGDARRPDLRESSSKFYVRFTPESGHVRCTSRCLLWANSGLMQRSK